MLFLLIVAIINAQSKWSKFMCKTEVQKKKEGILMSFIVYDTILI